MLLNKLIMLIVLSISQANWVSTYLLPLVGPSIVVFTFYLNDKKDRKNKRKEAKRAWYFKAYFEPSLVKVEKFFNDSFVEMEKAINDLNHNFSEKKIENRVSEVGLFLGTLAAKKRRFLIEVVDMLKLEYPKEAEKIENILMDFEDSGTAVFGEIKEMVEANMLFNYISVITELKAKMIQTLSYPALLIKKKPKKSPNSVVIQYDRDMV